MSRAGDTTRARSSARRAPAPQAGGRRSEASRVHQAGVAQRQSNAFVLRRRGFDSSRRPHRGAHAAIAQRRECLASNQEAAGLSPAGGANLGIQHEPCGASGSASRWYREGSRFDPDHRLHRSFTLRIRPAGCERLIPVHADAGQGRPRWVTATTWDAAGTAAEHVSVPPMALLRPDLSRRRQHRRDHATTLHLAARAGGRGLSDGLTGPWSRGFDSLP